MSRFLPKSPAARATMLYLAMGVAWVLLTDLLFERLTDNTTLLTWLDASKGWLLVFITAILIYAMRHRADLKSGQLAAVVASTDDAIIGAMLDGTITDWNPGAARLYEHPATDAIGQSLVEIIIPDDRAAVRAMLEQVRAGMTCPHHESVRKRSDGSEVSISLSMSPIFDTQGKVVGVSASSRDISDRKRAEAELRMAEFGKLASGLVHEIRNPLNAMRMQIAVIRGKLQRPDDENLLLATAQLSKLEREVLRVTNLATDFLAYGRPGPDHVEEFDVEEVLRDVSDFVRPEFEEKGLTVTCEVEAVPMGLHVRMDRGKLRQVLLNLAENARQSMSQGGRLELAGTRLNDREARITVADNGPGIPEASASQVFEPFFSTREGGTGLGLAIVKRTVETAGGRVDLVNPSGGGACFEILLPSRGGNPNP